jgi:hypothetical protein
MGILILGIACIYLLISIVIVLSAIRHARRTGLSAKRWGWGAAFVMWLIPFWDWLPTVAVHQYYCATESGFWVYKTLDQWKKENPGVIETLAKEHLPPDEYRIKAMRRNEKKYLLPDGTILSALYNARQELMFVEFKGTNGTSGYRLNERFLWATRRGGPIFLHRWLLEYTLVDISTNDVLARYVDFSTSQEPRQAGWSGWKFWLSNPNCPNGMENQSLFLKFINNFRGKK